jgi:hypothetical protein
MGCLVMGAGPGPQDHPPPAADELDGELAGLGDEPPPLEEPAVKLLTVAVTSAPAGDTSHHFAPKPSLPCPVAAPGPESPEK